jgi:hypothetical protein
MADIAAVTSASKETDLPTGAVDHIASRRTGRSGPTRTRTWPGCREVFADMCSFSGGGVYLNFPGFLEQLLQEGYGKNYEHLVPKNLFRLNTNIEPRS